MANAGMVNRASTNALSEQNVCRISHYLVLSWGWSISQILRATPDSPAILVTSKKRAEILILGMLMPGMSERNIVGTISNPGSSAQ